MTIARQQNDKAKDDKKDKKNSIKKAKSNTEKKESGKRGREQRAKGPIQLLRARALSSA